MAILYKRALQVFSLFGLSCPLALAQISPEFAKVLTSASEQQAVLTGAKQSGVLAAHACADGRFNIANKIAIFRAPTFDDSGALRSGTWKQVVDYTGCGTTMVLNVLVRVAEDQKLAVLALVPGATLADPQLQSDIFRSPAMHLNVDRWRDPACNNIYAADSVVTGKETTTLPGAKGPAWSEVWTIVACDRSQTMAIIFTPDSTGTGFTVELPRTGKPQTAPDSPKE